MIDLELIVDFFNDCWWLLAIVIGAWMIFVYNDEIVLFLVSLFNPYKEDDESKDIPDSFDDEECPDCTAPIPIEVVDGQGCAYCGHVFNYPRPH